MHTWAHTHTHFLKSTRTPSSKPLTFLQFTCWNVCSVSCACLFNYYRSPEGRRTRLVTSDSRKLVQTTWLGEVQCQCRVKASVGVIGSVKGSFGTSQFTAGRVVIQIQGNIWEFVHVGAHLSHPSLSPDIWTRLLLHGMVVIPQILATGDAMKKKMGEDCMQNWKWVCKTCPSFCHQVVTISSVSSQALFDE